MEWGGDKIRGRKSMGQGRTAPRLVCPKGTSHNYYQQQTIIIRLYKWKAKNTWPASKCKSIFYVHKWGNDEDNYYSWGTKNSNKMLSLERTLLWRKMWQALITNFRRKKRRDKIMLYKCAEGKKNIDIKEYIVPTRSSSRT